MLVYCITNKINGKKYIGSDSNNNPKYYGSGVYIKKAIKKHGKENFIKEILCEVDNVKLMKELEDMFKTEEFKSLNWFKRFWIRVKVAFIQTINMM